METVVLDRIPPRIDRAMLAERLSFMGGGNGEELDALIASAERVARPRALYKACYVDGRSEDEITIDGVRFTSRVLSVNLQSVHRVFPYVVTCGAELQQWSEGFADPLSQFHADAIKEVALYCAALHLEERLDGEFRLAKSAHMNPGSLPDWPLPQQVPLFGLLGDVKKLIGVTLTDSYLMLPTKSVSGIRFPTETSFESCQLCPRDVCPNRRAPYDPSLSKDRYGMA
jgi:hypothetical protein